MHTYTQGNGTRMGEYGDETSFMGGDYRRWHSLGALETLIWGFLPANRVTDPLIPLPSSTPSRATRGRNAVGGINVTIASMDDTNATQDLPYVLRINALGNTSVSVDYNRPTEDGTQKENARLVWTMPDSLLLDSADDR